MQHAISPVQLVRYLQHQPHHGSMPVRLPHATFKFHSVTGHKGTGERERYSFTPSLTSLLDGVCGQRHAPAAIYHRERPGTHCTGGWVGHRAGLDGRKISSPPGFDPGPSSPVAQSLYRLSYWAHMCREEDNIKIRLRNRMAGLN